jgi:hypothetical protein
MSYDVNNYTKNKDTLLKTLHDYKIMPCDKTQDIVGAILSNGSVNLDDYKSYYNPH